MEINLSIFIQHLLLGAFEAESLTSNHSNDANK